MTGSLQPMGRTRGCFPYNRPSGYTKMFWPEALQRESPVGVRLTIAEPQRAVVMSFEAADGNMLEVPAGVTVARVILGAERSRYVGVQLPDEEFMRAVGNRVFTVFPEHKYEIRMRGDTVFTLNSLLLHGIMDNAATGSTADPPQPVEDVVLQQFGDSDTE